MNLPAGALEILRTTCPNALYFYFILLQIPKSPLSMMCEWTGLDRGIIISCLWLKEDELYQAECLTCSLIEQQSSLYLS